jgi:hypothetical protein
MTTVPSAAVGVQSVSGRKGGLIPGFMRPIAHLRSGHVDAGVHARLVGRRWACEGAIYSQGNFRIQCGTWMRFMRREDGAVHATREGMWKA